MSDTTTEADLPRLLAIAAIEARIVDAMVARRAYQKAEPDYDHLTEYYSELSSRLDALSDDLDALIALRAKPEVDSVVAAAIERERKRQP